jgi:hypothetical protein
VKARTAKQAAGRAAKVAKKMKNREKLAPAVLAGAVQAAADAARSDVIAATPVDTGEMRRRWRFARTAWGVQVSNDRSGARYIRIGRGGPLVRVAISRILKRRVTREKRAIARALKKNSKRPGGSGGTR